MPVFRATPSGDLGTAIRRAIESSNAGPMAEIQADMAAAKTVRDVSLADKARMEVEQMQRAAADRANPALATEYATNAAGMDSATGRGSRITCAACSSSLGQGIRTTR
jgi:DNA-binding phage protein